MGKWGNWCWSIGTGYLSSSQANWDCTNCCADSYHCINNGLLCSVQFAPTAALRLSGRLRRWNGHGVELQGLRLWLWMCNGIRDTHGWPGTLTVTPAHWFTVPGEGRNPSWCGLWGRGRAGPHLRHGTWWILQVPHGPHALRPSASLSMFSTSTIRIFICDDGCVVSQDDVDDDYCHCSDYSDEDQHTCDDGTCQTFVPTCSAWKARALSFYLFRCVDMRGFEFPSLKHIWNPQYTKYCISQVTSTSFW